MRWLSNCNENPTPNGCHSISNLLIRLEFVRLKITDMVFLVTALCSTRHDKNLMMVFCSMSFKFSNVCEFNLLPFCGRCQFSWTRASDWIKLNSTQLSRLLKDATNNPFRLIFRRRQKENWLISWIYETIVLKLNLDTKSCDYFLKKLTWNRGDKNSTKSWFDNISNRKLPYGKKMMTNILLKPRSCLSWYKQS